MTEQEAIKILNPDANVVWKAYDGKDMERCNEACRVACVALAKQIPKKPIKKNPLCYAKTNNKQEYYTYDYYCPICNEKLELQEHHCPCGQALDWSD